MINQANEVSIEFSDRNLERRSDQELDGGNRTSSIILTDAVQDQLATKNLIPIWDIFFLFVCGFTIFFDPLFCYIPVLKDPRLCYYWDHKLVWGYIAIRFATDLLYAMDIIVFLSIGAVSSSYAKISLKTILPRILVALPIPQLGILIGKFTHVDAAQATWPTLLPLSQYSYRVYYMDGLLKERLKTLNVKNEAEMRIKAMLDFLPFLLFAHVIGAMWYLGAFQRQLQCWAYAICQDMEHCAIPISYFVCGKYSTIDRQQYNITLIKKTCLLDISTPVFDFGIYQNAALSGVTSSTTHLPQKILQCFWWGLRNMSSLGSNLQTSLDVEEVILSVFVSISGIALFSIYLNTRVQASQKRSKQLKLRLLKLQGMNLDRDLWFMKNGVAMSKDIKMMIMKNAEQKLKGNKDVDMHNIFSILPIKHRRTVMYSLRFASLRKVPRLEMMNDQVLKAMCEHLKPVTYTEDKYVIEEGKPLRKMIFIVQGTALTYTSTTSNTKWWNNSCSSSSGNTTKCLEKGDFCGEELLNWAFKFASFSDLPISTKTVISETKIEAFAITANHLRSVVSKFWWHFKGELHPSQLEHLAASSFQAEWRRLLHDARARANIHAVNV